MNIFADKGNGCRVSNPRRVISIHSQGPVDPMKNDSEFQYGHEAGGQEKTVSVERVGHFREQDETTRSAEVATEETARAQAKITSAEKARATTLVEADAANLQVMMGYAS